MRENNHRHTMVGVWGLVLTLLLVTLGSQGSAQVSKSVKVRLAELYQIHGGQMFDPLFPERARKYGLEVEVVPMKRYGDVQLALATGQVEFGAFGFVNIAIMAENNIQNVIVIAGNSTGGQGLILRKGLTAKVRAWRDLEGLKIGIAPSGAAHNIFRTLAKAKGVNLDRVEQVSFPGMGPEAIQALRTGDIDGLVAWEPTNAKAVVDGIADYSTLKLEESPTGNINGAFAVNREFAAKNPEATLNMVKTLVETTEHLIKNRDEWVRLASAKTGVDPAVVKEAMRHLAIHYDIPERKIKAFMDVLAEFGVTKRNYRDAVPRYVDYSYLEKATGKSKRELGAE